MDKKKGNKKKDLVKLTEVRKKVLPMIKAEPEKPLIYFGRKMRELGLLGNERSIYHVVNESDTMQREISAVWAKNQEKLSKDIVPVALQELERTIRRQEPQEVGCEERGEIVKPSECKRCDERMTCGEYQKYLKKLRSLEKHKQPSVKLALDKEFSNEESRRQIPPTQINIDGIQVYIQKRTKQLSEGAEPRFGDRVIDAEVTEKDGE